jgi:hypothetical protein
VGGDEQRSSHELRLLARHSQYGYTDRIDRAMREEPEAVSADEQQRLTLEAQRRDRTQRVVAWKAAHLTINAALRDFRASCRVDKRVAGTLRFVERQLTQLDRDVGR